MTGVLVHAADPAPLATEIRRRMPDAAVHGCDTYRDLPSAIAAGRPDVVYSIRFAGTSGFPREALLGPEGPQWIAVGGSGVDHLGRWDPTAVTVTNAAGIAADMMAEYVMGAALHYSLDIAGLGRDRAARNWDGTRLMAPLKGRSVLILGLGHTGRAVAARARAFGMRTIGVRARPAPTDGVDAVHGQADLPDLWGRADLIVVCAPLLPSTLGMLDEAAFAAMKPGAILVDVSRGGIVDGSALADALDSGRLAGAALDVFETEPLPDDHPLWQTPNTIISPHCSSVFDGWEQASIALFCDNLERWRRGETLLNVVDPARGY